MSDPNQPSEQPGPDGPSRPTPPPQAPQAPQAPQSPQYQPPYGQAGAQWPYSQPAGQPPPGQPPYPPGQHGGPYIPPTQQQGGGAKVWLLVIGLVLLVTCGGCFAVGALVVDQTGDVLREIEEGQDGPGNDGQVSVVPGEAFELGALSFAEGWAVTAQGPVVTIEGLVATTSEETDIGGLAIFLTFFRNGREVAQATCAGTVGSAQDEVRLDCFVTDRRARHADQVTVESVL